MGVGLYNFTWVPDLAYPESQLFMQQAANFCKTVSIDFYSTTHDCYISSRMTKWPKNIDLKDLEGEWGRRKKKEDKQV